MAENENICFLCEYMRVIDKPGNKWAPTFCNHPNSMYIENYRKTHNLKSTERFVGWTKRYSKELTIKTRPRWCPKKEGWSVKKMAENKMERKKITKLLTEVLIADRLSDRKYYAKEVSIDPGTDKAKRVDVMEFVPQTTFHVSGIEKGTFTCYEIKSCVADIFSGNGLNFFGERNYIVTTMETYKQLCDEGIIAEGKIENFIKAHNPDSTAHFGVMVPVPAKIGDLRNRSAIHDEFEHPTEFTGEAKDWRLYKILSPAVLSGRNRSTIELLFCMLRSKHSFSNR